MLGANFMRDKDVVFDLDNKKVGFATADCTYHQDPTVSDAGAAAVVAPAVTAEGTPEPTVASSVQDVDCVLTYGEPAGPCDAKCPKEQATDSVVEGHQPYNMVVSQEALGHGKECPQTLPIASRPCFLDCPAAPAPATATTPTPTTTTATAATNDKGCATADPLWSECGIDCIQHSEVLTLQVDGSCQPVTQHRDCSVGKCPIAQTGYQLDLSLAMDGMDFSLLSSKDHEVGNSHLLEAVSFLLQMPGGDLEVKKVRQRAGEALFDVALHFASNSTSLYNADNKALSPLEKAMEVSHILYPFVISMGGLLPMPLTDFGNDSTCMMIQVNSTISGPLFLTALQAKLKESGGMYQGLSSLSYRGSNIKSLEQPPIPTQSGAQKQKATVFYWDIIGGSAAVLVLLMLIIHFRLSYWQTHAPSIPTPGEGSSEGRGLIARLRSSIDVVPHHTPGSRRTPKPSTRSYERVQDNEFEATVVGNGGEDDGLELGETGRPLTAAEVTTM